MTLYIIANPHAGNHGAKQVISDIEKHHTSDICTLLTRYKNDELHQVERLLKTFDPEKDKLLIVGGDGTLSKVLYHLLANLPFAYCPVGSGNDFARALDIVPNLEALLASLTNLPKEITVYSYQEGLVLNSLDLGFAAWVVNQAANSTLKTVLNKCHFGKLTYVATAIQFLLKNPLQASVSLESSEGDNLTLDDHFFFSLANNTYFGGGSVKVIGHGTIDDYIKMAKANFSKGNGAVDDVVEKASGAGEFNINEIRPKLKTDPDTAFFCSGRTDGVGGADIAANVAKGKGGTTLESTIANKNIKMPKWDFNNPSSMEAWDLASGAYAEQVSGQVRAVVGSELRPGNIWENVELPRLKSNPNVTQITTIDPKTGIEKIIFERK